jgi:lysophospholipase L1-like esterase
MAQIIGFGASMMEGVGGANGGWLDLIKLDLHKRMYGEAELKEKHHIYNLGVSGHTSFQTLGRMKSELEARAVPDREYIFLFNPSINNDSKGVGAPDNILITPEQSAANVEQAIKLLRQYSSKILLLSSNPTDDKLTNPIGSYYFESKRTRLYNAAIAKKCAELDVPYINLLERSMSIDWLGSMMFKDGLHPNAAGHEWIAKQIKPELYKLLGIQI